MVPKLQPKECCTGPVCSDMVRHVEGARSHLQCEEKKLRVCIAFIHIGNQLAPRAQSSMSYHTILWQFFITRSCTQWVSVIPPWGGGGYSPTFSSEAALHAWKMSFSQIAVFFFYSCVHSGYYCDKTFPSMFFLLWLCQAMKHVHNLDLV